MQLRTLRLASDLEEVFPVLRELRPHLSFEEFIVLYEQARHRDGYEVVAAWGDDRCLGLMGYRVLFDLVHGKHLYVDDLVVTEEQRSQGVGAYLLKHAEEQAERLGCRLLRLSTGLDNEGGQRFYEREGWKVKSVTFKKGVGLS